MFLSCCEACCLNLKTISGLCTHNKQLVAGTELFVVHTSSCVSEERKEAKKKLQPFLFLLHFFSVFTKLEFVYNNVIIVIYLYFYFFFFLVFYPNKNPYKNNTIERRKKIIKEVKKWIHNYILTTY